MNLILDIGNTLVKLAVFKKKRLLYKTSFPLGELMEVYRNAKKSYPELSAVIISSVGRMPKSNIAVIKEDLRVLELNHLTKVPFNNLYASPKTLGVDRIALVSASVNQFPNKNVLIIDAGTCVTYDFINQNNDYLGGAISPGLRLRYKSLNTLTANLPLLETQRPLNIIGDSTASSIHSGVVYGLVKEIDGVIDHYKSQYQDLTVILTGGDAEFLSNQLKNSIFASSNFLLEGLNFILDFNS
ncbi:type III pantothenate kinase [Winogradskyella aurantia]|uniref:Type III pantothenate kinase n=1 Tax=Winogradskyella aurantia TaxID=1915063 RepID=A0A265UVH5_9FLAO|nr:type III pantothenate kinase [Winogradskyella aurantia]OZV69290.1 pantothenate kinase [Winogradskyella aurantia]